MARLELHHPPLCATSCNLFPVIQLHLILYLPLIHSLPHSPTFCLHYSKWNLRQARWGITIHRRIKKHTSRELSHSRKQPIIIVHQMFVFPYLQSCIILQMTNVPDYNTESGWWYRSGDWWGRKWGHWTVHRIIRYWRRRFGSPTGGPTSRPGAPGHVIMNFKGPTAQATQPCRYCHCMPSASKFPKSSWGHGTTTAQTPKVSPPQ